MFFPCCTEGFIVVYKIRGQWFKKKKNSILAWVVCLGACLDLSVIWTSDALVLSTSFLACSYVRIMSSSPSIRLLGPEPCARISYMKRQRRSIHSKLTWFCEAGLAFIVLLCILKPSFSRIVLTLTQWAGDGDSHWGGKMIAWVCQWVIMSQHKSFLPQDFQGCATHLSFLLLRLIPSAFRRSFVWGFY